jgi:poly [ADP-ribose] polymerase 10/14/15
VEIEQGDAEHDEVVKAFMKTLKRRGGKVLKVERIQNLAMWQSYVVKRQTICYRETGHISSNVGDDKDEIQRKALKRFERRWLWHGSDKEVMEKIFQQGFNRSFCGKNATVYGKVSRVSLDKPVSLCKTFYVFDSQKSTVSMVFGKNLSFLW